MHVVVPPAPPAQDEDLAIAAAMIPSADVAAMVPAAGAAAVAVLAAALDDLGVALCLFDAGDRTVLWNRSFLRFFPEHDGHVHAGEPYRRNLERFYDARLPPAERSRRDEFVAAGLVRHRAQSRPYGFSHRGRRLLVTARAMPDGGRLRIWTAQPEPEVRPVARRVADPFRWLPDGAMVLDGRDRIVAVNAEFLLLYDAASEAEVLGRGFRDVVAAAWAGHAPPGAAAPDAFLDDCRFAGAPFEVELPGDRWRRVVERRTADGTGYISHADITALKQQQRELREAHARLAASAATDPLTGLSNRRRFEEALAQMGNGPPPPGVDGAPSPGVDGSPSPGNNGPLSLLLVDVDHFKRINDRFGHPAGDRCLRLVARRVAAAAGGADDLAARLGGEEFALLLRGGAEAALRTAESLRAAVAADRGDDFNAEAPVTVSIGVATLAAGRRGDDPALLVQRADAALYRAKRTGRDRVAGPD